MPTTNTPHNAGLKFAVLGSDERPVASGKNESITGTGGDDGPLLSFFIPDLTVGGAEQVTVNLVNGLSSRGYNVELLLSKFKGELQSNLQSQVKVRTLPPSRTPVVGVAAHLPALATYLQRKRPVALFPHLAHPSIVCLAVNRLLDTDTLVIPTHHSAFGISPSTTVKDRVVRRLVPHLYPSADRIITVSEGVADSIIERTSVSRADISVLYNPVDIAAVRRRAREPVNHEWIDDDGIKVILFVGRIAEQKDLKTWLRTFKRVHDQDPTTRAVIVGQGPRRQELQRESNRLGIADVVSMPGYVENPFGYMYRSEVFLLTSLYEGLPTVLIEALACGCPVVATDCPAGPGEVLVDGKYGHLVAPGDVAGLCEAVVDALENPMPSDELQERSDDFAPERVLDRYERFITDFVVRT